MYVVAKKTFNHGGIVALSAGERDEIRNDIAEKLIKLGLVEEVKPSYKKLKIKSYAKPVDQADNDNAE